ncbi:hypothetical protein GCM10009713_07870 [Brevibacterium celere]
MTSAPRAYEYGASFAGAGISEIETLFVFRASRRTAVTAENSAGIRLRGEVLTTLVTIEQRMLWGNHPRRAGGEESARRAVLKPFPVGRAGHGNGRMGP